MRNLLALFAAATLTLVGLGWYLGWYSVKEAPADDGHRSVNIDIDSRKIGQDLHKGEEKLQQALDKNVKEDTSKQADSGKSDKSKSTVSQ
ncbi:MAG TPA: hypothetical protein VK395_24585 [Gemmataceae bacterium]|nr:hypothetical protein [Gemmataceae bacterium]